MESYSVSIKRRSDGLFVAKIPSLAKAVGYGLDQDEALCELIKAMRERFRGHEKAAEPALMTCSVG